MFRRDRCCPTVAPVLTKTVIWLAAGTLAVASPLFGYHLYLLKEWDSYQAPPPENHTGNMIVVFSGIRMPPAKPAPSAELDDEAEVIGVCVGNHARAYAVESMGFPAPRHVVNDMLGGRAVSVTYCDRRRCSRVFTRAGGAGPLALDVGGWLESKGMLLHVEEVLYAQETGENLSAENEAPIPYPEWPHVRTTWGSWRKTHPDSDVYVGEQPVG